MRNFLSFAGACLACFVLVACQGRAGNEQAEFYSYVDAQGNLVVVDQASSESKPAMPEAGRQDTAAAASETPARTDHQSQHTVAGDKAASDAKLQSAEGKPSTSSGFTVFDLSREPERYQSAEEVEEKLLEEQRDRFVTYFGPEGEVITRPLDMVEEREAAQKKNEEKEAQREIDAGEGQYQQTQLAISRDCCSSILDSAQELKQGRGISFRFGAAGGYIQWGDQQVRAEAIRLLPGITQLRLRSFKHADGYVHPFVLLLDKNGEPLLAVDNPFSQRFPESWSHLGYLEGTIGIEASHKYAIFVLPYWSQQSGMLAQQVAEMPYLESDSRLSESGELYIKAL